MTAAARVRPSTLIGLGVTLARHGLVAWTSLAVSVVTVVAMGAVAITVAGRANAPLHTIPILTSSALAWGGGFLLAFGAAVKALRRDVEGGVRHMFEGRAVALRGYLVARVGGLAALVGAIVAGGTLVVGVLATLLGLGSGTAGRVLQATFASVVFGLAFAIVIAPTALFALGARRRFGGYITLFLLVVFPEIVVQALGSDVPSSIADVATIPSALGALRASLGPGTADVGQLVRALVGLAAYLALSLAFVRREATVVRATEAS